MFQNLVRSTSSKDAKDVSLGSAILAAAKKPALGIADSRQAFVAHQLPNKGESPDFEAECLPAGSEMNVHLLGDGPRLASSGYAFFRKRRRGQANWSMDNFSNKLESGVLGT